MISKLYIIWSITSSYIESKYLSTIIFTVIIIMLIVKNVLANKGTKAGGKR